jgi:hypothetical protein
LAVPGDDDGLDFGRGCSQLHQNNCHGRSRYGRKGVHDNAQLAVVSVGLALMEVRYLRDT